MERFPLEKKAWRGNQRLGAQEWIGISIVFFIPSQVSLANLGAYTLFSVANQVWLLCWCDFRKLRNPILSEGNDTSRVELWVLVNKTTFPRLDFCGNFFFCIPQKAAVHSSVPHMMGIILHWATFERPDSWHTHTPAISTSCTIRSSGAVRQQDQVPLVRPWSTTNKPSITDWKALL